MNERQAMDDEEYELMDELYFVISFNDLQERLNWPEERLKGALLKLIKKGFAYQMIYNNQLNDFDRLDEMDEMKLSLSSFLASKSGLLAHNLG